MLTLLPEFHKALVELLLESHTSLVLNDNLKNQFQSWYFSLAAFLLYLSEKIVFS